MATKIVNILLKALTILALISNTFAASISQFDRDVPTSNCSISTFKTSNTNPAVSSLVPFRQKSFTPCPYDKNVDFADGCYCWGSSPGKYAIDRRWMMDAINGACQHMTNGLGEPVRQCGINFRVSKAVSFLYTFTYPSAHDNEEGKVAVTLVVDDMAGCIFQLFPVSREYCMDTLHVPIDGCNVKTENSKNGGVWRDGCIWWVVDPAPAKNQPYNLGSLWN